MVGVMVGGVYAPSAYAAATFAGWKREEGGGRGRLLSQPTSRVHLPPRRRVRWFGPPAPGRDSAPGAGKKSFVYPSIIERDGDLGLRCTTGFIGSKCLEFYRVGTPPHAGPCAAAGVPAADRRFGPPERQRPAAHEVNRISNCNAIAWRARTPLRPPRPPGEQPTHTHKPTHTAPFCRHCRCLKAQGRPFRVELLQLLQLREA